MVNMATMTRPDTDLEIGLAAPQWLKYLIDLI